MIVHPPPRQPLLAIDEELDDAGWDLDALPAGAAQAAAAAEARGRAGEPGAAERDARAPERLIPTLPPERTRESTSGRLTQPPPMPEEEYVEHMMRQARPSDRPPSTSRETDPGGESLLGLLGEERSREDEERTRRRKSDAHNLLWGELRPP